MPWLGGWETLLYRAWRRIFGSRCMAPFILNIDARWTRLVSMTPWPLYPRGRGHRFPLDGRVGGPQNLSGHFGEEGYLWYQLEIEPRFLGGAKKIADTLWAQRTEKVWKPLPCPVPPLRSLISSLNAGDEFWHRTEQQEKNYISGKQTRKQKFFERSDSRRSPYLISPQFYGTCNFDTSVSFPNIWTASPTVGIGSELFTAQIN